MAKHLAQPGTPCRVPHLSQRVNFAGNKVVQLDSRSGRRSLKNSKERTTGLSPLRCLPGKLETAALKSRFVVSSK